MSESQEQTTAAPPPSPAVARPKVHRCMLNKHHRLEDCRSFNSHRCIKCNDIYFSCETCADGLDAEENDKGTWCGRCYRHFCIACWQHSGTMDEDSVYTCAKCADEAAGTSAAEDSEDAMN